MTPDERQVWAGLVRRLAEVERVVEDARPAPLRVPDRRLRSGRVGLRLGWAAPSGAGAAALLVVVLGVAALLAPRDLVERSVGADPGTPPAVTAAPETSPLVGVVLAAESAGLFDVDSFSLRTRDGAEHTIALGELSDSSLPAYYLGLMQRTNEPVRVRWQRDADGSLVAVELVHGYEAWLDRPLPDAPVASSAIQLGATLWDPYNGVIPDASSVFLRIAAADGRAVTAAGIEDWPGHYEADVRVPDGAVERLEVGTTSTVCAAESCEPFDILFPVAGIGAPTDAPITAIATAEVRPPATVTAGEPSRIEIEVLPRADWPDDSLRLPDELLVTSRRPGGAVVSSTVAPLTDRLLRLYGGDLTLAEPGRYVLRAGVPDIPGGGEFVPATAVVNVEPPVAGTPAAGDLSVVGAVVGASAAVIALTVVAAVVLARRRST